jgi:hypothetical protein
MYLKPLPPMACKCRQSAGLITPTTDSGSWIAYDLISNITVISYKLTKILHPKKFRWIILQMARRITKNKTGISRVENISSHDAWASYSCINCGYRNYEKIGLNLPNPSDAYKNFVWTCVHCVFVHSRTNDLPFHDWPADAVDNSELPAQRFWTAFFRSATENAESYWKQCNVCSRILPNADFSRHVGWGPLEKQMECRACKAVINAHLNPKRTTEQLRESGMKRRIAELLVATSDEKLDVHALFKRFSYKCFKTGTELKIEEPSTWQIDHTLPSKYFYPLSIQNATLLSTGANQNKSGSWPQTFYTNEELIHLAEITGAPLDVLSNPVPIVNENIDVNSCVGKFLKVRGDSDLSKRINELKVLLNKHELSDKLSPKNKKLLGIN